MHNAMASKVAHFVVFASMACVARLPPLAQPLARVWVAALAPGFGMGCGTLEVATLLVAACAYPMGATGIFGTNFAPALTGIGKCTGYTLAAGQGAR